MVVEADVIVLGVGTMGSMALWRLARRGASVVGLEQFAPGHDRGSGHGDSRMIRTAYYEGPEYVPLVQAAFPLWRELEAEAGVELLTMTGALMIGRPDGALVGGALRSARAHGLACETLSAAEAAERFPQHRLAPGEVALWEAAAGVLRPERAIVAAAERAITLGAELLTGVRAERVAVEDGSVTVQAANEEYRARHLIVCAGPWLGGLLPGLDLPLAVERQVMIWFSARDPARFAPGRFPAFGHERAGPFAYGLPSLDGATVKVAFHHGGRTVSPDDPDREVTDADLAPVAAFVAEALPDLDPRPVRAVVCVYTNTPDEHFVVGPAPGLPGVTVLGGFSGHGFKFAPVLGEIAADLALEGRTAHPIAGFSPARFGLPGL
ncbi:MAG TPA: N-methyl-L-tryptophan oxidase [Candidatus Dormibacteraeota bacterium]|nr:N-methyl-L-tryptophan oxidase [Candidatus Dormibacteraeota bacterium]